jgi:hypothetical protein
MDILDGHRYTRKGTKRGTWHYTVCATGTTDLFYIHNLSYNAVGMCSPLHQTKKFNTVRCLYLLTSRNPPRSVITEHTVHDNIGRTFPVLITIYSTTRIHSEHTIQSYVACLSYKRIPCKILRGVVMWLSTYVTYNRLRCENNVLYKLQCATYVMIDKHIRTCMISHVLCLYCFYCRYVF